MEWFVIGLGAILISLNLLLLGTIAGKINRLSVLVNLQGQFIYTFTEAFQRHFEFGDKEEDAGSE